MMLSYEQAREIILSYARPMGIESLPVPQATGRVLAASIRAPFDLPHFDNSAVDGFGVKLADVEKAQEQTPSVLKLAGTLQAGDAPDLKLEAGTAVKILTGAPVPEGVEAVIMQEYSASENGSVSLLRSAMPGENIRYRGEEFQQGAEVLPTGHLINPPVAGLLATLGYHEVHVYQKPKIAILVTGNELVKPGETLRPGQIYESNSYSLAAALEYLKLDHYTLHHAPDEAGALQELLAELMETSDVVITTGGVSVGEYDLVKEALSRIKVQAHFWKVAIKPGKPVFFGTSRPKGARHEKLVFGLPGNPVAVLLTFHLLVRPALLRLAGMPADPPLTLKAQLAKALKKKAGRLEFIRARLFNENNTLIAAPALGQGSHMLGGLAVSDALILFPLEETRLEAGKEVDVMPISWCCNV